MRVSVIVPCRNEAGHLQENVRSILDSLDDLDAEVLLCDGASTDGSTELIQAMAAQDSRVRMVPNPARYAPHGMNAGLREARGAFLFIISAHAAYPPRYFHELVEAVERHGAACAGGLLRTEVKASTPMARAIRGVLGDPFGVGNATFRTGATEPTQVDTVAFGCYPRWAFEQFGGYDERLIRNQDIELNKRIQRGGGSIWLIPGVTATYYARPFLAPFLRNQFENGRWNILTVALTGSLSAISLRHLVPAGFVMSLLLPLALFFVTPWAVGFALAALVAYLPLAVWRAWLLRKKDAPFLVSAGLFPLLHLSYGLGSLVGALQVPLNRCRQPV